MTTFIQYCTVQCTWGMYCKITYVLLVYMGLRLPVDLVYAVMEPTSTWIMYHMYYVHFAQHLLNISVEYVLYVRHNYTVRCTM